MSTLILIIVALIIFVGVQLVKKTISENKKTKPEAKTETTKTDDKYNFDASLRRGVLTKHEQVFYWQIAPAIPDGFILLCKVRMEDLFKVHGDYKEQNRQRNMIKSRHFDYVVCNNAFEPCCVIELDDKSHQSEKQQHGDTIKNRVCEVADVPLFRITTKKTEEPLIEFLEKCGAGSQAPGS